MKKFDLSVKVMVPKDLNVKVDVNVHINELDK